MGVEFVMVVLFKQNLSHRSVFKKRKELAIQLTKQSYLAEAI